MILNLGVVDIPYVDAPPKGRKAPKNPAPRRRNAPHKVHEAKYRNVTTGDVAQWLENRYHIMEHFWQLHGQEVADNLAESYRGALETFLMGGPANLNPAGTGLSKSEHLFRNMLSLRELDQIGYPGIPTVAAQMGVSHRHKSGYTKNRVARPSFIDTGLYSASFKMWLE